MDHMMRHMMLHSEVSLGASRVCARVAERCVCVCGRRRWDRCAAVVVDAGVAAVVVGMVGCASEVVEVVAVAAVGVVVVVVGVLVGELGCALVVAVAADAVADAQSLVTSSQSVAHHH